MSATKTTKTNMTDIQMLKRILEEKFGWTKFEIKTDDKKPLVNARMWSGQPDIVNPDLVVRQRDTGGNYADFAAKRNPDGTLSLSGDPHGLQNIPGYEKYRGKDADEQAAKFDKDFKDDVEIEYSKKEKENQATAIGAESISGWTNAFDERGEYEVKKMLIDEDSIDQLQDAVVL